MVKSLIMTLGDTLSHYLSYLPPCLLLFIATAFIENGKYMKAFRHEFIGTLLMICCTFSAGKWIGESNLHLAWTAHAVGVIAADFFGGGPQVNPAVTMSMWCLGKVSYTEAYVRMAAQMGGGLVAFPFFHAISEAMAWTAFGGPEFRMGDGDDKHATEAFLSEFGATTLLMFAIYILNWEINFGQYHYIIKQFLTAVAIRALIEFFPTAGPAMNPMLATAWDVFGVGEKYEFPSSFTHYFVYWIAPWMAAILASVIYVIYAGGTVFGAKLPIGPFKSQTAPAATTTKKKKN